MSADLTEFDWANRLEEWCDTCRLQAPFEVTERVRSFIPNLAKTATGQALKDAVDWAITEACIDQRRDMPWYFPAEIRFFRWIVVMAARRLIGYQTTRRVALPLLEWPLGQPCASLIAFWRCDSFRLADLSYVFELKLEDVMPKLVDCDRRWQDHFARPSRTR